MTKVEALQFKGWDNQRKNDISREIVCANIPRPQCRNLSYIDSRCLGLLNPNSLLEILPKSVSNPKTLCILVEKNPHLKRLLSKSGLQINNGDFINFLKFTDEHMKQTARIASRICDEIKKPIDKSRVVKAARLHDIGKIFIPASILNKPDNLTPDEKSVMSIHAELGNELLKLLKIDEKTRDLIKNHHNCNSSSSLEQQIVSAADVYSALIEERPYKKSMSHKQAMNILEQSGFSKEVTDALKKI